MHINNWLRDISSSSLSLPSTVSLFRGSQRVYFFSTKASYNNLETDLNLPCSIKSWNITYHFLVMQTELSRTKIMIKTKKFLQFYSNSSNFSIEFLFWITQFKVTLKPKFSFNGKKISLEFLLLQYMNISAKRILKVFKQLLFYNQ